MTDFEIHQNKEPLKKLVSENIGNYARLMTSKEEWLMCVKLHEMHIRGVDVGFIIKVELYTPEEDIKLKNNIFNLKVKKTKSNKKWKL